MFSTHAQIITTIAGLGPTGAVGSYSGDTGPASAAGISRPGGIIRDTLGNIYFADAGNRVIRKIDTNGIISTFAGTGSTTYSGDGAAAIVAGIMPGAMAIDARQNIYLCDRDHIRMIDLSGIIKNFAGTGTVGYSGDNGPATDALLDVLGGITVDNIGNVYLAEGTGNHIRKIDTFGIIHTIAGTGISGATGDGGPATGAELYQPAGIAVDRTGNLYIASSVAHRVRRIDAATGIITTITGNGTDGMAGDNGPATDATIGQVDAIAVDDSGNIYLGIHPPGHIRMINVASGIITSIAGDNIGIYSGDGGPAIAAGIHDVQALVIAPGHVIYLSDNFDNRVRLVNYLPFFLHGHTQSITLCKDSLSLFDSLLTVIDSNAGQRQTLQLVSGPAHGSAAVSYIGASHTDTLKPSGLSYTPTVGYTGHDTISVRVTDGIASDTTVIYINVINCHLAVPVATTKEQGISVYPSPNDGTFTFNVSANTTEEAEIIITDVLGKQVKHFWGITNKPVQINTQLQPGAYFISATIAHNKWSSQFVIADL